MDLKINFLINEIGIILVKMKKQAMVLLSNADPDDCEIARILSWDYGFTGRFLQKMSRFGWKKETHECIDYLHHPDPDQWWIRQVKTTSRYWYEIDQILYQPQYEIYFHGCCVALINVIVFRNSTHYEIKWHEDELRWAEQWKHIAWRWKANWFDRVQDYFIGRKTIP